MNTITIHTQDEWAAQAKRDAEASWRERDMTATLPGGQ